MNINSIVTRQLIQLESKVVYFSLQNNIQEN